MCARTFVTGMFSSTVCGVTRTRAKACPLLEGAKAAPMCPEYGVTYLSGRTRA